MPDLTKLKNYSVPEKNRTEGFKKATNRASTIRKTPYIDRIGGVTQSYLGFNVISELENANESSNAGLLAEVAKLEKKTQDMSVAGEALRRKATELAAQAEIKTETVTHVLKQAESLGKANNEANSAMSEFLRNMAIVNQKADNKDAFAGLSGEQAFREEQASFSERVRNLFTNAEQKAIDSAKASELAERLRVMRQKQTLLNQWTEGKLTTEDIIEPHRELMSLRANKEKNGEGKGSIFSAIWKAL